MRVAVVYVLPAVRPWAYLPAAKRFVATYLEHWPGVQPHELHVVLNGEGPITDSDANRIFEPFSARIWHHSNYAKDIGAYRFAVDRIDCDVQICLGAHVHFHRDGWLDRMIQAYTDHGPGLYGCWGYDSPACHIRTTAFWLPPELLRSYPYDFGQRYAFEHGKHESILQWCLQCQMPVFMVGWNRVLPHTAFEELPEAECLVLDQHTDRLGYG